MCGITGHVVGNGARPDFEAVRKATGQLRHRGPDSTGFAEYPSACFGHRRLGILDLTQSKQPWKALKNRYCLVFNGEIYNYVELRRQLERIGYTFRTSGDTEVLMNMFIHYGRDCLNHLNGMFAFGIWDEQKKSLFLARDRIGKKPLYFKACNHGLAFASELHALLEFEDIELTIDLQSLDDFFAYQFIPGASTIYQGVRKLEPAHWLTYQDGHLQTSRYWAPPMPESYEKKPFVDLCDELRHLLDDAVKIRLRSDVAVGAFLSGGIDSCAVVSTLRRLGADLETFTVGFDESSFDERPQARAAASFFHTQHHDRKLNLDVANTLPSCIKAFGEPFADPSAIPTWHLCHHARQYVTVALSGDGADELFGGYRRYLAPTILHAYRRIPLSVRKGFLEPAVAALPETDRYFGESLIKKLKLLARMANCLDESPMDLLPQTFSLSERYRLLNADASIPFADHRPWHDFPLADTQRQMMHTDIQTYLPEDILTKVDRMSMAHSLEVRSPMLDYRVVEFACRLPTHLKIRGSQQKYILRKTYKDALPRDVLQRRKHGFSVPLSRWFRRELKDMFHSFVLEGPCPDFLNANEIRRVWNEHQSKQNDRSLQLWSLLVFFIWQVEPKTR